MISQQGFDVRDRSVSPVTFDSELNSKSLLLVGDYIDQLRLSLAVQMNRCSVFYPFFFVLWKRAEFRSFQCIFLLCFYSFCHY